MWPLLLLMKVRRHCTTCELLARAHHCCGPTIARLMVDWSTECSTDFLTGLYSYGLYGYGLYILMAYICLTDCLTGRRMEWWIKKNAPLQTKRRH